MATAREGMSPALCYCAYLGLVWPSSAQLVAQLRVPRPRDAAAEAGRRALIFRRSPQHRHRPPVTLIRLHARQASDALGSCRIGLPQARGHEAVRAGYYQEQKLRHGTSPGCNRSLARPKDFPKPNRAAMSALEKRRLQLSLGCNTPWRFGFVIFTDRSPVPPNYLLTGAPRRHESGRSARGWRFSLLDTVNNSQRTTRRPLRSRRSRTMADGVRV